MSRIYFHSEHGTAELRGSERAYMGGLCQRMLLLTLPALDYIGADDLPRWRRIIPPDAYLWELPPDALARSLETWLLVSGAHTLLYQGRRVSTFDAALNTALALGNDPVKLAARLHGQCEIYCYVEGPHRAWLAEIMEQGRAINLYRPDQGWEGVIALLRSRADGPVVCSYSVCQGFPNGDLVAGAGLWTPPPDPEYPGEADWSTWEALSDAERWDLGMRALRQTPARGLELTPDEWADAYLSDGVTGMDLRAWMDGDPT